MPAAYSSASSGEVVPLWCSGLHDPYRCADSTSSEERGRWRAPSATASPPSWCCFSHPTRPCLPGALGGIYKRIWNLMSLFAYSEDSSPTTGSESNVYFLSIPAAESHTQTLPNVPGGTKVENLCPGSYRWQIPYLRFSFFLPFPPKIVSLPISSHQEAGRNITQVTLCLCFFLF